MLHVSLKCLLLFLSKKHIVCFVKTLIVTLSKKNWWRINCSLPTKKNLQQRKIISDPTCDQCGEEAEESLHTLWGCQTVKHIWWEFECCKTFLSKRFVSFRDLFQGILAQKNQHMVELFAYMGWNLWFNRNARRVGSTSLPTGKIFSDAVERLQEYHSMQDYSTQQDVILHLT